MVLHWSWMDASSHCPNSSRNLITKNKYPPWTPLGLLRNANGPSLNCQILHTKGMPDYSKALNTHWGNNSLEVCFFSKLFFFFLTLIEYSVKSGSSLHIGFFLFFKVWKPFVHINQTPWIIINSVALYRQQKVKCINTEYQSILWASAGLYVNSPLHPCAWEMMR